MTKLAGRLRVAWVLIAVLLMLPLLATIPLGRAVANSAPSPQESPAAAPASHVFEGGGWGHAVGLSQWGAYGMAKLAGADYAEILNHYYTGSDTAKLGGGAVPVAPLWVNLEREIVAVTLRTKAIRGGGTETVVRRKGPNATVAAEGSVTIEVVGTGTDGAPRCRISTSGGFEDRGPCNLNLVWDGDSADPSTRLVVESVQRRPREAAAPCLLPDWNAVPTSFRACSYSRGKLHVRPDDGGSSFHLVAEIDINDYVLGISEMPYYWSLPADGTNGVEALKAQAVAARTYAARRALDRGNPADRPFCWCHVYDTTVDQRYVGWGHSGLGQSGWIAAATATDDVVATHPAITRDGKRLPILAFYSSSSYGHTEPSEIGFGSPAVYLKSVDDSRALDPRIRNPQTTWTKTMSSRQIARNLGWPKDRKIASIEIAGCSPSGAASEVRFIDRDGVADLRPTRLLRTTLGLRSPQITSIDGAAPCRGNGDAKAGVVAGALTIDDDTSGDSVGNGNGTAQCGETVELRTALRNSGNTNLTGVTATLSTENPHLDVLHNSTSTFPTLGVTGSVENDNDWDLAIAQSARSLRARLRLEVTADQGGPWVVRFDLAVRCGNRPPPDGKVTLAGHRVDDGPSGDSVGNGDGVAQCGETIELFLAIENQSSQRIVSPSATLDVDRATGRLLHNADSDYPTLEPGALGENANDWDIALAKDAARLTGTLTLAARDGRSRTLPVDVPVTCRSRDGSGRRVVIASVAVDDDGSGDSVGNGDGRAQCGETVELRVTLRNRGQSSLKRLTATFVPKDARLTLLHNADSDYPNLAPGGRGGNANDFDLAIAPTTPAKHEAPFRIEVTDGRGRVFGAVGALPITCADPAPVAVGAVTVDDGVLGDSVGNGDGKAQCGETIELYVELENQSSRNFDSLVARLRKTGRWLDLLHNRTATYPTLAPGGSAENENDWDLDVAADTPHGTRIPLRLVVSGDGRRWRLPFAVSVRCPSS